MVTVKCFAVVQRARYMTKMTVSEFETLAQAWNHLMNCPHGHEVRL